MKNIGRYPDRDTSLAHRKLSRDRLAEVSMTDDQIINVIDSMTHNHVTPDQVDAEAQGKLARHTLTTDANLYIDQSQVGSSYASLSNGRVPTNQLPTHPSVNYLETGDRSITSSLPIASYSYGSEVSAGSITISDPNCAWIPVIFGSVEVNAQGNSPIIITLRDNENRIVAGGMSTRGVNFNRVNITPENIQIAYTGSWSFTFYLRARDGGSCNITSFQRAVHYFPVPWTPS